MNHYLAKEFLLSVLEQKNLLKGQLVYEMLCTEGTIITPDNEARMRFFLKEDFPKIQSSTIENYLKANTQKQKVSDFYGHLPDILLLSNEELDTVLRSNYSKGWKILQQKYPDSEGIIDISIPGFLEDKQEALFYMGWRMGDLIGSGHYYFYRFIDGMWTEISSIISWIS